MIKMAIADIANIAGVSKSTVSRVLNKNKLVKKETGNRVLGVLMNWVCT